MSVLCSAKPKAARMRWSPDRTCASTVDPSQVVEYGGVCRPVCKMHVQTWNLAVERGTEDDLAEKWGWGT